MAAAQQQPKQVILNLVFACTVVVVVVAPASEVLIDKTCFLKLKAGMVWCLLLLIVDKLFTQPVAVAGLMVRVEIMAEIRVLAGKAAALSDTMSS